MNKQPVYYSQHDAKWGNLPYQVSGETDTISASGCGPSCAAMLISTLTGKRVTPADTCKWSVEHGYKAKGQGTYYSYFTPQFEAYGLDCKMLNWSKTYGNPDHPNHDLVAQKLKEGYYAIALMKRGNWTPGGHFIVVWWQDDKVRINDPNSTRDNRTNGDIRTFRSEVQYYWLVDARKFNTEGVDNMTDTQVRQIIRDELLKIQKQQAEATASLWAVPFIDRAVQDGIITDATRPQSLTTRQEVVTMIEKAKEVH